MHDFIKFVFIQKVSSLVHYWNSSLVQSLQVKLKLFVTRILPQLSLDHPITISEYLWYDTHQSQAPSPDGLEHGYVQLPPPANQPTFHEELQTEVREDSTITEKDPTRLD